MDRHIKQNHVQHVFVAEDILIKRVSKSEGTANILSEDLAKLLEDPETSDLTLKCGSKIFKVHKAILGTRCNVFKAMFGCGMKEMVEGEAVIKDVDEKSLEEVLHYLYTGKLSGKEFDLKSLINAALKYQLDPLMDLLTEKIRATQLEAEEVAEVFIAGEVFGREEC